MDTIRTILTIIFVLVSVVMTALILMQEGKGSGLSGGIAGAAGGDSYVSRNQSRTKEGKMKRYTTILVAAFMVLALLLNVLQ